MKNNKQHNHATTSNTDEVFRTFIGCQVKGLLHDDREERHAVILVFSCGWGLAFNCNGSHWTVSPEDAKTILRQVKNDLAATKTELEHILELAGEPCS